MHSYVCTSDCGFFECRDHAALVKDLQKNRTNKMHVSLCVYGEREKENWHMQCNHGISQVHQI